MYNSEKTTPAVIEFVDIAGLVKGASKGEGLGNQFLANIREVDAIVHVVRCFEDPNVIHVEGSVDPIRDIETINLELIFSDIEILDRRISKIGKQAKMDKTYAKELELVEAVKAHLEEGKVVLFGAGSGCPYFSTDTAAVLRAAEIGADAILLAKNIDGVYSADPAKDPTAVKYDEISYDEVLAKHLAVMDLTATSLAMENDIPVVVFALADPQNIVRAVMGEPVGTVVTK